MIALNCGRIIDGTGSAPIINAVVLIKDGSIAKLGKRDNIAVDGTIQTINLESYTVLPGLIDSHDHLGTDLGDEEAQSREADVYTALRGVKNAREILRKGITTLRDMGEKNFIDIHLKRAIEEGIISGPRLLVSGRFITRTGGHVWFEGREADGPYEVRKAVREQVKVGADLIKIMISGGISTEGSSPISTDYTREEIEVAVEEAHRSGRKIAAHIHGGEGAEWAIEAGIDSIEHGIYLKEKDLALMAIKGVFLVVTTGVIRAGATDPKVPVFFREKCNEARSVYADTIRRAREIGVKVVVGCDELHGQLANEMTELVNIGFTPIEAIQSATKFAAELCGLERQIGTLEEGKWADCIAVAGNPIEDMTSIDRVKFVAKRGKIIDI